MSNTNTNTNATTADEIPSTPANRVALPTAHNRYYKTAVTALTIYFWYGISNGIILTTKWLFTDYFPYPLTVTTFSNGVAWIWALLASCFFATDPMTKRLFLRFVLPIGICTALEIGSSNLALKLLTVSFGTILKGGGPIFTFLWGLAFGLEQFSLHVGISLVLIAVGIALASLGEGQEFQMLGFVLQLSASALGGLRWAMTHKLLKEGNDSENEDAPKPMSSLTAVLYCSPMTSLCVLPFALALEGKAVWNAEHKMTQMAAQPMELESTHNTTQQLLEAATNSTKQILLHAAAANSTLHHNDATTTSTDATDASEVTIILTTMTAIATLVFILLMSEYWLVKATSSLALSVAGVFKELLTIGGGIFFFSENIDALNVVGFTMCQLGIMSYVCLRTSGTDAEGEYAPVTVEEAAREAMEAQREMVSEFPPERFVDDEESGGRFSIDDEEL